MKEKVKTRYADLALRDMPLSCCSGVYTPTELADLPPEAAGLSLGCGNPVALASLRPGEMVLDIGSGAGLDVFLAARKVGPTGRAIGLDMTEAMIRRASQAAEQAGFSNVEFRLGDAEEMPLPDESVDVIISNCVINLSADKPRVLAEAFRVLRPGGLFAVSDIVVRGDMPEAIRRSVELWVGCVAGALEEEEYLGLLRDAGFSDVEIEPTRVYRVADAADFLEESGLDQAVVAPLVDEKFMAAFVRARKPAI
jgi:SAM-dependent methyltransferase